MLIRPDRSRAYHTFLATIAANEEKTSTLYNLETLTLAAPGGGGESLFEDVLSARFQALPFVEPMTGLVYARARWYDPSTGSFLSPDPKGYVDSANLYSFAGGDPVNGRDPTGEDAYDDKYQAYVRWWSAQYDALWQQRKSIGEQIRQQRKKTSDTGLLEAEDRILATRMMTFGGISENAILFFDRARAQGNAQVLSMSFEDIHAEIVSDEAVRTMGAAVVGAFMPHAPSVVSKRGRVVRAPRVQPQEPEAFGPFAPQAPGVVEAAPSPTPVPAPYQRRRPNLRKSTVKANWDSAPEGTVPNSKACLTCGEDVFGNPHTGQLRNTPEGWDVEHVRKWEIIRRELQARGATPAEYRDAYNDLNNTILRCRKCNRGDNRLSN